MARMFEFDRKEMVAVKNSHMDISLPNIIALTPPCNSKFANKTLLNLNFPPQKKRVGYVAAYDIFQNMSAIRRENPFFDRKGAENFWFFELNDWSTTTKKLNDAALPQRFLETGEAISEYFKDEVHCGTHVQI